MALTGPLPAEYVSEPELLPAASTVGFTCVGLGVTFGPPLAGWMFDVRGDYFVSFGFAAGMMALGVALMVAPLRAFGGETGGASCSGWRASRLPAAATAPQDASSSSGAGLGAPAVVELGADLPHDDKLAHGP